MFTGIVDHMGEIISVDLKEDRAELEIRTDFRDLQLGESIAVDGGCLTVTEIHSDRFFCDLSKETLSKSIAGKYKANRLVNLERALRLSDRIGGHLVSGHVDQSLLVAAIEKSHDFFEMRFNHISPDHFIYLIPKGSIAINGVSLTVNEITVDSFSVLLIPHTLARTNLSRVIVGDRVNVEFDQIAKLVDAQVSMYLNQIELEEVEFHDKSVH